MDGATDAKATSLVIARVQILDRNRARFGLPEPHAGLIAIRELDAGGLDRRHNLFASVVSATDRSVRGLKPFDRRNGHT